MIPADVIQKIRRIQITTSHMVTDVFAGHYQSVFKGKGMEFEEVREYQLGDDVRSIDWNVTARMGHPYVKKFVEERELTVMFLLDLSRSCHFGTIHQFKNQLSAEICSLLAFSAIKNNDRIGLILFTDRVEKFIPPRKGTVHVMRVIRDALCFKPEGKGTNIPLALEFLNKVSTRRTVTFILSDFHAPNLKKPLSVANKRHDLVAITLSDPIEMNMPSIGIVRLEDAETEESFLINTSDPELRNKYNGNAFERVEKRDKLFNSIHVDHIDIRTDLPYLTTLIRFFRMREKRYAH